MLSLMRKMNLEIECKPSNVLKVYSKEETWAIEKAWMDVYCKNKQGFNTKDYKWHIFSGGRFPSISGEKALTKYRSQNAAKYIVMSNDHELAILTDLKPESCNLSDYYVFPVNMAWTMAFTHEEGWLGPYFAFHPNFGALEKENEQLLEKKRQKEIAKQKGWY